MAGLPPTHHPPDSDRADTPGENTGNPHNHPRPSRESIPEHPVHHTRPTTNTWETHVTGVLGIHHITAIAGDPAANLDYYTATLKQRCIKVTVNFDDPARYHLYYANNAGCPGSVLTFFPWPGSARGKAGAGNVAATAYAISRDALEDWAAWLQNHDNPQHHTSARETRFGEHVLRTTDHDGTVLELIAAEDRPASGQPDTPHRFHSVTLAVADPSATVSFLTEALGMRGHDRDAGRVRLVGAQGLPAGAVDVIETSAAARPSLGRGSVHHIAFRVPDDEALLELRQSAIDAGARATDVRERCYFRSVYFREPGGVIVELATDGPGFDIDETPDQLGSALRLPPWFEDQRQRIEAALPRITLPNGTRVGGA